MATTEATRSVSAVAAAALTAGYFAKFVTSTAGVPGVNVQDTAQRMPHGIIGETVASGRSTSVVLPGCICKAIVGSVAITAYAKVASHSDGTMIAHGASNGDECCGMALEAGGVGELISIYFAPLGQTNA